MLSTVHIISESVFVLSLKENVVVFSTKDYEDAFRSCIDYAVRSHLRDRYSISVRVWSILCLSCARSYHNLLLDKSKWLHTFAFLP